MNGRAYDYNLGRFLSVDPFIQFPENSQSLNPYSYILNNPLSGTDPTGYMPEIPSAESCAAGPFQLYCDTPITNPASSFGGFSEANSVGNGRELIASTSSAAQSPEHLESPEESDSENVQVPFATNRAPEELVTPLKNVKVSHGGTNTKDFLKDYSGRTWLRKAIEDLGREARVPGNEWTIFSTPIIPIEYLEKNEPAINEGSISAKVSVSGQLGQQRAKDAGAVAIVARLPKSANNSIVSRGSSVMVRSAIDASQQNDGIPVFLHAPRGPERTVLAIEFKHVDDEKNVIVGVAEVEFK